MIFVFKNKEYCFSDWKINPNDMTICYRNIISDDGKNKYSDFIGISNVNGSFSLHTGGNICNEISFFYKEIFKSFYLIDVNTLEEAREKIDKFLLRIDNIKAFI
jgi:hypothetical protein